MLNLTLLYDTILQDGIYFYSQNISFCKQDIRRTKSMRTKYIGHKISNTISVDEIVTVHYFELGKNFLL